MTCKIQFEFVYAFVIKKESLEISRKKLEDTQREKQAAEEETQNMLKELEKMSKLISFAHFFFTRIN